MVKESTLGKLGLKRKGRAGGSETQPLRSHAEGGVGAVWRLAL